jgi:hypothetical protein
VTVPPYAVQITVAGRVGPALESVFADLDVEVSQRHTVVTMSTSSMPEVMRLLKALDQRDVEFDRVVRSSTDAGRPPHPDRPRGHT